MSPIQKDLGFIPKHCQKNKVLRKEAVRKGGEEEKEEKGKEGYFGRNN